MRPTVIGLLSITLFGILVQGQGQDEKPSYQEMMKRQAYRNYLLEKAAQLQKQMIENPQTEEEKIHNMALQTQSDRALALADNEFLFGLRAYIRTETTTATSASANPPPTQG